VAAKQKLRLYVKSTCTTCRQSLALLKERGEEFETVDLFETPLEAPALQALIAHLGLTPREVLRTKDPLYAELGLATRAMSDTQLVALMAKHPGLIQRPIAVRGRRAIVARPAARIAELLEE